MIVDDYIIIFQAHYATDTFSFQFKAMTTKTILNTVFIKFDLTNVNNFILAKPIPNILNNNHISLSNNYFTLIFNLMRKRIDA